MAGRNVEQWVNGTHDFQVDDASMSGEGFFEMVLCADGSVGGLPFRGSRSVWEKNEYEVSAGHGSFGVRCAKGNYLMGVQNDTITKKGEIGLCWCPTHYSHPIQARFYNVWKGCKTRLRWDFVYYSCEARHYVPDPEDPEGDEILSGRFDDPEAAFDKALCGDDGENQYIRLEVFDNDALSFTCETRVLTVDFSVGAKKYSSIARGYEGTPTTSTPDPPIEGSPPNTGFKITTYAHGYIRPLQEYPPLPDREIDEEISSAEMLGISSPDFTYEDFYDKAQEEYGKPLAYYSSAIKYLPFIPADPPAEEVEAGVPAGTALNIERDEVYAEDFDEETDSLWYKATTFYVDVYRGDEPLPSGEEEAEETP